MYNIGHCSTFGTLFALAVGQSKTFVLEIVQHQKAGGVRQGQALRVAAQALTPPVPPKKRKSGDLRWGWLFQLWNNLQVLDLSCRYTCPFLDMCPPYAPVDTPLISVILNTHSARWTAVFATKRQPFQATRIPLSVGLSVVNVSSISSALTLVVVGASFVP